MTVHGHTRVDNYYWLKERENPEVLAYLKAENQYADACLKHTEPLQKQLFKEITGRIKQDDNSVPIKIRDYYHYTRFEEGKEYPLYCRKKHSLDAPEEVMLDGNQLAEGHAFFKIGEISLSEDDRLLAYSVDTVSRRIYTVYVKDLETGKLVGEPIENTSGNLVWASDNKTLFYGVKDEALRPCKIMRHRLGTAVADDVQVYEETDETFVCYISKTKSRKYLIINSDSTLSSESRILESDRPEGEFRVFQERQSDMLYGIDHYKEHFYIQTNADGARNYKIMRTPVAQTEKEHWVEVVFHREQVMIEDFSIFDKFFVVEEREGGLVKIRVMTWDGGTDYYIDFGEPAYTASVGGNPDFDATVLRYSYTSMTTPSSVFEFDMEKRTKTLLKQQEVVGGYNPADYVTERLMVPSHDGVLVPVSIVYKKNLSETTQTKVLGPSTLRLTQGSGTLNRPLVLYGYGSYGSSVDAYFSVARLSLLDRGFIWAIAHIRGGEEMGRQWYEEGKMLHKKNTFLDFIACAEHLIYKGYTSAAKMFAMGGSAGGLLVGAVVNMRPDLWKGIIAQVPFVDVVTTMLDESIPLTTGEYDEWGNPNEKQYYDYMLSYSPYDNVEAKDYPAMLITTGLHDSQVQYWEPAKWAAKLRALKTDKNSLYLKTEMDYGHGGASGRFECYKEIALEYAFMLVVLGPLDCASDSAFKRAARRHQSDYRCKVLGCEHDASHRFGKYGAYLKWNDAKVGKNFYLPYWPKIEKAIKDRYPESQPWQLAPIYANMLRSEHIPFNIFVPMRDDMEAAKRVFGEIIGIEQIDRILDILIEYAPEKQFALNDGTSFDVFVPYQHKDGKLGGIGIEIKYTEVGYPLKKGSKEERDVLGENKEYVKFTSESGYYKDSHVPLSQSPLIENNFRQIWRNHILGASMMDNNNIEYPLYRFNSVTIFPSKNEHFAHVIPDYEALLTEYGKKSFKGVTYEDFFDILDKYYITNGFSQWISYLRSRYLFQWRHHV